MQKCKISIIEDDEITSLNLKLSLEKHGYEIISIFDNTQDALENTAKNIPDIFIIDISLDDSDDGIKLAKTFKETYGLPFIYLTSHSTDTIIEEAKLTRPYGYIVKPFHPNSLHASIQMALFQYKEEQNENRDSSTNITVNEVINKQLKDETVTFANGYSYNLKDNVLFHYEEKISLKEVESLFIRLLVVKLGLVVTFDEATEYILNETKQSVSIRTLVWRLRTKLVADTIQNAQEIGYYIEA